MNIEKAIKIIELELDYYWSTMACESNTERQAWREIKAFIKSNKSYRCRGRNMNIEVDNYDKNSEEKNENIS